MKNFIELFEKKSRHHKKLINFMYPELKKIKESNILEFGVSEKGMSTELFLEYANNFNCKLFSIDIIDYSKKFNSSNWKFLHSRDDNFDDILGKIPKTFKLILLDTVHEASHVRKIFYKYYDLLEINHCFFIDDISWLPYLKNSEKNRDNFDLEFNFEGTGICKIRKKNNNKLNELTKINLRNFSLKNLARRIIKR